MLSNDDDAYSAREIHYQVVSFADENFFAPLCSMMMTIFFNGNDDCVVEDVLCST